MDACHLLLDRPWQYDGRVSYDGFKNSYSFVKDEKRIVLAPLKPAANLGKSKEVGSFFLIGSQL